MFANGTVNSENKVGGQYYTNVGNTFRSLSTNVSISSVGAASKHASSQPCDVPIFIHYDVRTTFLNYRCGNRSQGIAAISLAARSSLIPKLKL
jgi:hypothetical protein